MDFQGYTILRAASTVDEHFIVYLRQPTTTTEQAMYLDLVRETVLGIVENADVSDEVAAGSFTLQGKNSMTAQFWVVIETLNGLILDDVCEACEVTLDEDEFEICSKCEKDEEDEEYGSITSNDVYRRAFRHFGNAELAREAAQLYPGDFI